MIDICTAYTKDHRRCRLEQVGGKTCHIHRNYYREWFVKHPVIRYGEYTQGRKLKELVYQFRNHITITEKMFKDWVSNFAINNDNFEFLILYGHINPMWSLEHLKSLFFDILYSLDWCTRLSSILTSPEVCIEVFKHLLLLYEWGFQVSWSTVFYPSNWRKVLYSSEFMDVYNNEIEKHKKSPDLVYNLRTLIYPCIQDAKNYHRQVLRSRATLYKEELMMVCWHPSRIEMWIKDGGMELCDNMMGL